MYLKRLLLWWRGRRTIDALEQVLRRTESTHVEARFCHPDFGSLGTLPPAVCHLYSITVTDLPRLYRLSIRAQSGWYTQVVSRAVAARCVADPWHVKENFD